MRTNARPGEARRMWIKVAIVAIGLAALPAPVRRYLDLVLPLERPPSARPYWRGTIERIAFDAVP